MNIAPQSLYVKCILPKILKREEVRGKIIALAEESGFSVKDIIGKHRKPSFVKFRNPSNPEQSWTGQGRRPAWFKKAGEDKCRIGT